MYLLHRCSHAVNHFKNSAKEHCYSKHIIYLDESVSCKRISGRHLSLYF